MARGTRAMTERVFKEWARDTATTIGASDEANNQLYVAALSAGHTGDHGAWRQLSGLMGRDMLVRLNRASDPEHAVDGIQTLRRAGDVTALKLAVRRLGDDGPAIAVRTAGESVDLQRSTRTTLTADLEFLKVGGVSSTWRPRIAPLTGLPSGLISPSRSSSSSRAEGQSPSRR